MSATHTLPGPDDITRAELLNGIVVLSRANFYSPSVFVHGLLTAGALFEPNDRLGLADFTASCLMRGTSRRTFQQIYDTLESAGASLGFSSGAHSVSFSGKALVEDLDTLLALLAEALQQPVFLADEVERLRALLLTSLAIRSQDTGDMASLTFDQIVYAGHPYSRPEDGFPETVQAIQQADLFHFHSRHYGPRGMLIAVVGGIDPAQAVEKVNRYLGDWHNPDQASPPDLPPLAALPQRTTRSLTIQSKAQADIVMGAAGPPRSSPDFMAASLGNDILGQFGMMGRIGYAVREEAGLAYHAASSLSGGPGPGPWEITAGVEPANVEKAVELILQQVQKLVSQPVSAEELADSQASFIGRLPVSMETNAGVAAALIRLERYQLGLDYYRRYPDLVKSVSIEEVLEAAGRYLDPQRLGIAIAGP